MIDMVSIISTLDADSSSRVNHLWERLHKSCGLKGIYQFPTPHFTWFVADEIDLLKAQSILEYFAITTNKITTHAFGFGLFSGQRPVLYSPVVKSQEMITIHAKLWDELQSCTDCPHAYYSPRFWLPHITMAINDLNQENLACALKLIALDGFTLNITVDNLILVLENEQDSNQELYQYRFGNGGEAA